MHFDYHLAIINIAILAVHGFAMLAAAVLIYIKHTSPNDRSKSFLFTFFFTSAIVAIGEIVIIMHTKQMLDHYQLIPPQSITMSGITFFLLLSYLLEAIRPQWLTFKRLLLVISPWLVLVGITLFLYIKNGEHTRIYSVQKLASAITNPDVLTRLALTASLCIYTLWAMFMCCFTKRYNPKRPLIRITMIITLMMTITFFHSRGLQLFWAYIAHEVLYIALSVLIIYVEHYERLHIPYESVRTYYTPAIETAPSATQESINQVSIKLCNIMEDPDVWQDPTLTRDTLVQLVGTNRTYLQEAVKLLGFKTPSDMLYRRRIEHVCECLRKNPTSNLQEVFYDAGFQSRTTAWRHFTEIVGCTPTEFIEKNTTPPPGQNKVTSWFSVSSNQNNT